MKNIILIYLLCFALSAEANQIEELVAKYPRANIAYLVQDISTGEALYSRNAQQLMLPASVTKVFTAYASLKYLGSDFVYTTQLLQNGKDYYLRFSGDPSLTMKNLQSLINKIPKNQKTIYIDDTSFEQDYYAPGWSIEDSKFCFAAPLSAIIINENCFKASLMPDASLKPSKFYASIDNKLSSKADPSCSPELKITAEGVYELTGCVNSSGKEIFLNIAYYDPRILLKNILPNKKLIFRKTPNNSKLIAEVKSNILADLVKLMLKESNNIYANAIAKTVATKYYQRPASFEDASNAIKSLAENDQIRLMDGSGTSRYNLIAPDHLVNLLAQAKLENSLYQYFYDSLPIAGVDGSLENSFADHPELHNLIRAKSGSMKTVYALAGYLNDNQAFAIMINSFMGSRNEAAALVENILSIIADKNTRKANQDRVN